MGQDSLKSKIICGTVLHHVDMMLVKRKGINIDSTMNNSQGLRDNLVTFINKCNQTVQQILHHHRHPTNQWSLVLLIEKHSLEVLAYR